MMEEFSYQGWWWDTSEDEASENPHTAGTLSFSHEEGLRLELLGVPSLEKGRGKDKPFYSPFTSPQPSYPILWGRLSKGKLVTLLDCTTIRHAQSNWSDPTQSILALRCSWGYIGDVWLEDAEETFDRVTVDYPGLLEWAGSGKGFKGAGWIREEGKLVRYPVDYHLPDHYVTTTSDYEISLFKSMSASHSTKATWNEVLLRETARLGVRSTNALTTTVWLSHYVIPLGNLLSLAMDRPVYLLDLFVFPEVAIEQADGTVETQKRPLKTVFSQIGDTSKEWKRRGNHGLLFSLADLEFTFDLLIEEWFQTYDKYKMACKLYFDSRHRPPPYLESKFLVLAQTIEILHRIKFPTSSPPPLSKTEEERIQEVVQSAPQEHHQWLEKKLSRRGLSFRQRCEELFDYTSKVTAHLVGNPSKLGKLIANARNHYTHYSSQPTKEIAQGIELYWLTEILDRTIACFLLNEAGLSPRKTEELFLRNRRFQNLRDKTLKLW